MCRMPSTAPLRMRRSWSSVVCNSMIKLSIINSSNIIFLVFGYFSKYEGKMRNNYLPSTKMLQNFKFSFRKFKNQIRYTKSLVDRNIPTFISNV